jgi:multisubunit Na+/H+ antiporter MnhG subunit
VWSAYTRKSFVGMISYVVGVAATFFSVHFAFVLYALTPLFFFTLTQVAPGQR